MGLEKQTLDSLADIIAESKKRSKELETELQKYILLSVIADSFVDLKPEHKLYDSIRRDLINSINAVKGDENENKI